MLTQFYMTVKKAAAGAAGELQGPSKGDCLEVQALLKGRGVSRSLKTSGSRKLCYAAEWGPTPHRVFDLVYYTCARKYTAVCRHLWLPEADVTSSTTFCLRF